MRDPTPQTLAMQRLYRWQAPFFDATRWPLLRRRAAVAAVLRPGAQVVEVGCGTGHNLAALRRAVGPEGSVLGIECAPAMARRARRRLAPGIEVREAEFDDTAPACDAIVFAYSLSMMPDFAAVLARAEAALRPGGQIVVLDFLDSPLPPLRALMRASGVTLGLARRAAIHARFRVTDERTWRACGGLWRYGLTVGYSKKGSTA